MPTPKKAYCFTLNNYTEEEYESLRRTAESLCDYAVLGREVGESGTPHIQGYCRFRSAYRFQTIKDRHLPRCHIEVAAGSSRANFKYCSKGGDYWEHGSKQREPASKDEQAIRFRDCARRGRAGLSEFADEFPSTWYFSGSNLLRNYWALQTPGDRPGIRVTWCYGEPGVGKSRYAHGELPEAYVKDPRTKWWNGYMGETDVIIDDFGPQGIDINHLLRWFDRYKCWVESKGGMLALAATRFIVTSNFSPESVFTFGDICNPQLPALLRRIEIKKMTTD